MSSVSTRRGDRLLSSSSPDDGTVEVRRDDGSIDQFATSVASSPISLRMDLVGFLPQKMVSLYVQYKHQKVQCCTHVWQALLHL